MFGFCLAAFSKAPPPASEGTSANNEPVAPVLSDDRAGKLVVRNALLAGRNFHKHGAHDEWKVALVVPQWFIKALSGHL